MRGLTQQICNHLQREVTRRLPLFYIQTRVVEASPTRPCTHVSFTQPFLRNRPTPATKNKVWSVPVRLDAAQHLFVLSGLVRMSLQVSGARWVLRPQCVHIQVSCTSDPARMSTDRPAAESSLRRALIGSPMRVAIISDARLQHELQLQLWIEL